VLLLMPLVLPMESRKTVSTSGRPAAASDPGLAYLLWVLTAVVLVKPLVSCFRQTEGLTMFSAINSHPAVKALGHDFLLSLTSWSYWLYVGGHGSITAQGKKKST